MFFRSPIFAAAFFTLLASPVSAKRGILPEDYLAFQFLSDVRISPDGKNVAYVITTIDRKADRRVSAVWAIGIDGNSPPRRLTAEGFSSNSPRWSPDGSRLAFLSARNTENLPGAGPTRPQLWILPLSGGEAKVITHLKNGASSFQWSPDGERFVVVSRSGPSDAVAPSDRKSDVRHYTHIDYKFNDTGWYDDKRSHLWVVDPAANSEKQITSGNDWNDTDPQWSPDSTLIAFVSDRTGKEYDEEHNKDIWIISAKGGL